MSHSINGIPFNSGGKFSIKVGRNSLAVINVVVPPSTRSNHTARTITHSTPTAALAMAPPTEGHGTLTELDPSAPDPSTTYLSHPALRNYEPAPRDPPPVLMPAQTGTPQRTRSSNGGQSPLMLIGPSHAQHSPSVLIPQRAQRAPMAPESQPGLQLGSQSQLQRVLPQSSGQSSNHHRSSRRHPQVAYMTSESYYLV